MRTSPKTPTQFPDLPPKNPTDSQRHKMLLDSLTKVDRPEDYENIVRLLGPPQKITSYGNPGEFKGKKVGIIGGGLAGMSTAFELRKLGYDITVFEPHTERIGGRIYTHYFDKDKKLYAEFGAGRIPASHEIVWHYINLFKLNTEPVITSNSNAFIYVKDVRVRTDPKGENVLHQIYPKFDLTIKEANTPWPELYDQVVKYYLSTLPPEVRKQFLMILPRYDYRFEALQDINTRQALEEYGLTSEAINLITSVMPAIGSIITNSYEAELHSEYTVDYQNLYLIPGGMVNLPLAFYKSLTSPNPVEYHDIPQNALGKVTWKGGFVVNGILKSHVDGKVTLRYRNVYATDDFFEDFNYVIVAVPFTTLRAMDIDPAFSSRKMQAIKEVSYRDAQKTFFLCKQRFWEKQEIFGGSSYTDEIIGTISYPHDHAHCIQNAADCSSDEPGVLMASYTIGGDASALGNLVSPGQYLTIRSKVEKVHGLPRWYLDENKTVIDFKTVDWVREPWFHGGFQMFLPGQKREFLYVSNIPEYDNRVFFAGEHTSTKNGWIQGALQSGMAAANDVAYYSVIHKHQR
ncbi:flavin-dependent L-tryptophan oxidase RebO precursor [Oxobacter pfennigii]|uniref:Flavin-dependent L-tryptophan oxidase RebO n=1 Tax=Oxobacter pfennigii TaxID=36849 RepID=A0A0P9AKX6_9CLOT|nr:NAD(P)/FAD-dependent oxidoreductase [Oxobacter pfennigii]KPU45985.1 flavin-dependent L-tryptophan oxidase RebO precursor [Oxobacter pfennigii]